MPKVVYNDCYGGFSLSEMALNLLREAGVTSYVYNIDRHNPFLVAVVEKLGEAVNGPFSKLAIQEITGNLYRIQEYDGYEWVEVPEEIEWVKIDTSTIIDTNIVEGFLNAPQE